MSSKQCSYFGRFLEKSHLKDVYRMCPDICLFATTVCSTQQWALVDGMVDGQSVCQSWSPDVYGRALDVWHICVRRTFGCWATLLLNSMLLKASLILVLLLILHSLQIVQILDLVFCLVKSLNVGALSLDFVVTIAYQHLLRCLLLYFLRGWCHFYIHSDLQWDF